MARLKAWREVVKEAILGGKEVTNDLVYKRVAKLIGAKELTSNQKAKVRQQLQLIAKKPKGPKKKTIGHWKYDPKLPPKKVANEIVSLGASLGFVGEYIERQVTEALKTLIFEFEIGDSQDWPGVLMTIAEALEAKYGKVDTSIEFLVILTTDKGDQKEQWWNLTYGGSPIISAGHVQSRLQDYHTKSLPKYHGAIETALAFSFTLFIRL